MLARLDWITLEPKVIVDAGCATGEMSRRLHERYPGAQVMGVDSSSEMIAYAKQQTGGGITYHCNDAAVLSLPDQSADLVFANFLVPWHADVKALLHEWRRILRPQGLLMFTALGPDTLREWRAVWSEEVLPQLADMHDVGDELLRQGFVDPVLDVNHYTMTYGSPEKLVNELYVSGVLASPVTPDNLNGMEPAVGGRWPVTYEVVFAHTFVSAESEEISASEDGIVRVPLAHLRQRMRGR